MAKHTNDNKRRTSSSDSGDDLARVDVHLGVVLDAITAAECLTAISGFRMNEDVVEITGVEDDRCTAVVTCRNASQAQELVSAINATTADTSLTARLHGTLEPWLEVERTWEQLCGKAQDEVERHQRKAEEVRSWLEQIGAKNRKGRGVEFDEYLRQEELRRPLQEKLVELDLQEKEFCGYMDSLQARLGSCPVDEDLTRLCEDFELERTRFERALPVYAGRTDILKAIAGNQVCMMPSVLMLLHRDLPLFERQIHVQ